MDPAGWHLDTLAAQGGGAGSPPAKSLAPPIVPSSVFVFDSLAEVDDVYEHRRPGYIYGRYGTPNHTELEQAVARLEGTEAAVSCASGMAVIAALLAGLGPGDHVVAARDIYGSAYGLLAAELPRLGGRVTFVDVTDLDGMARALTPGTRWVFVEIISNPLMRLADVGKLAALAREAGTRLIVDGTFASPALCRPIALGAGAVVHSATKYLSGHSDVMAGLLAGPRALVEPVRAAAIRRGHNLSPFDAWLTLRGLRTLHLRMERHSANALAVARFLQARPEVSRVHYPGLPGHPQAALARDLLPRGAGGMLSFELARGGPAARRFVEALGLIKLAPSLGDVTTTVSYPATTSHRSLRPEERAAVGVTDGLIRVSVGIEHPDDILADVAAALEQAGPA
jgi:cystathionine beta-lyase/cystathionine gamma-synthase